MASLQQERERRAYDVLSGNRGQRKGSYQRYVRGPVAPVKKEEKKEEAPKRHWAELIATIEWCDMVFRTYNIDREPVFEAPAPVTHESEVVWSVPTQFRSPQPTSGQKIDVNTIATMHNLTTAPVNQAEPMPANGNALSADLPMLQLQMLALRPKI